MTKKKKDQGGREQLEINERKQEEIKKLADILVRAFIAEWESKRKKDKEDK